LVDVGEAEFVIQDSWGRGIPITDSMVEITNMSLAMVVVMGLVKEAIEEVMK
jgi:hypothetical protein